MKLLMKEVETSLYVCVLSSTGLTSEEAEGILHSGTLVLGSFQHLRTVSCGVVRVLGRNLT